MKTATLYTLVFGFAVTLCASVHSEELPEDKLIALARESQEAPSVPGVDSEIERRALEAAGNFAFRNGHQLVLALDERTRVYTDNPECKEEEEDQYGNRSYQNCGSYKLIVYAKSRDLFVLQRLWNGAVDYVVVERGMRHETLFADLPHLSPTGDFAVGTNLSQVGSGEEKQYPEPHLEISMRGSTYHVDWDGAPHYPKKGIARYIVDGWRNDDPAIESSERAVELLAHLEVDGKVRARFKVRKIPLHKMNDNDDFYKVIDIRR